MTKIAKKRFTGVAAAALCLACVVWLAVSTVSQPAVARQGPPLSEPQAFEAVGAILEPAAWAVAGVTPSQAQAVVTTVVTERAQSIAGMLQSQRDAEAYAEQFAAADEALQRGGATPERLEARDTAEAGFESAMSSYRASRAELKSATLSAIASVVGSENAEMARRWSLNATRKAPDPLKAADLSAEQWRHVESLWRRTLRGEEVDPAGALELATLLQSVPVVNAEARFSSHLPALNGWLANLAHGQQAE